PAAPAPSRSRITSRLVDTADSTRPRIAWQVSSSERGTTSSWPASASTCSTRPVSDAVPVGFCRTSLTLSLSAEPTCSDVVKRVLSSRSPSETVSITWPTSTRSPAAIGNGPTASRPFTRVPLRLPRSRIVQRSPASASSACALDTVLSRSWNVLPEARPRLTGERSSTSWRTSPFNVVESLRGMGTQPNRPRARWKRPPAGPGRGRARGFQPRQRGARLNLRNPNTPPRFAAGGPPMNSQFWSSPLGRMIVGLGVFTFSFWALAAATMFAWSPSRGVAMAAVTRIGAHAVRATNAVAQPDTNDDSCSAMCDDAAGYSYDYSTGAEDEDFAWAVLDGTGTMTID